jgi:flagellar biosynthesis protein FlhA
MPTVPFLFLAGLAGFSGYRKMRSAQGVVKAEQRESEMKPVREEKIEDYLQVDPIELEIGYALIPLVDEQQGGDLFNRITNMRKQLAIELGIIIPPVRVRDNLQLDPSQYIVKIRGNVVARDSLIMDRLLAMNASAGDDGLDGINAVEPAFGLPGRWIEHHLREEAEINGYTVVEPSAVLSTHLQEILKRNADKILGRQDTKKLIDNIKREYPAVVEELTNDVLPIGTVQKVLQNLLKEGIPVRDLVTILESLLDYSRVTKNVDVLTEYVRHSLSETIAAIYRDQNGIVQAIAMDPKLEETISTALQNQRESSPSLGLSPETIRGIHESLTENIESAVVQGVQPVVLCSATIRPYFYRLIHTPFPNVAVVSFTELPPESEVEFIGQLEISYAY